MEPIARWLFNEADSGTDPSSVVDDTGNGNDLDIDYGEDGEWVSLPNGSGLQAASFVGLEQADLGAILSALSGATKLTYIGYHRYVIPSSGGSTQEILDLSGTGTFVKPLTISVNSSDGGDTGSFSFQFGLSFDGSFVGGWGGSTAIAGVGDGFSLALRVDTEAEDPADRIKAWVNGDPLAIALSVTPPQGHELAFDSGPYTLRVGAASQTGGAPHAVYYAELYTDALPEEDILTALQALAINNDADWQQGVVAHYAVIVPAGEYDGEDELDIIDWVKAGVLSDGETPAPWAGSAGGVLDVENVFNASDLVMSTAYEVYYVISAGETDVLSEAVPFSTAAPVEVPTAELEIVGYAPEVLADEEEVPGIVVSDDFNRADGGLGSNWTVTSGGFAVVDNQVSNDAPSGDEGFAFWNADEFPPDQYAEMTITALDGEADYIGVAVRVGEEPETGITVAVQGSGTGSHFHVWVEGTRIQDGNPGISPYEVGDRIRLEVEGDEARVYKNGNLTATFELAEGYPTSGQPGVRGYRFQQSARGDNWQAGSLGEIVVPPVEVEVPLGTLAFSGYAPGVTASDHQVLEVPAAELALTGYAPGVTASDHLAVEVPVAGVAITSYAPGVQVSDHQVLEVPAAELALTGYAPSLGLSNHVAVEVPKGTLALTRYIPQVIVPDSIAHYAVVVPEGEYEGQDEETIKGLVKAGLLSDGETPAPWAESSMTLLNVENIFNATGLESGRRYEVFYVISTPDEEVLSAAVPFLTALAIPVAEIQTTGYAPNAGVAAAVEVPAAELSFTGYAPSVAASDNAAIEVPAAGMEFTGYEPMFTGSALVMHYASVVEEGTYDELDEEALAAAIKAGTDAVWSSAAATEFDVENVFNVSGLESGKRYQAFYLISGGEVDVVGTPVPFLTSVVVPTAEVALAGYAPDAFAESGFVVQIPKASLNFQTYKPSLGQIEATPDEFFVEPGTNLLITVDGSTEPFTDALINDIPVTVVESELGSTVIAIPDLAEFKYGEAFGETPWYEALSVRLSGTVESVVTSITIVEPDDALIVTANGYPYPDSSVFPEGTQDGFTVYCIPEVGEGVEVLANGKSRAMSSTWLIRALAWDSNELRWLQRTRQFETTVSVPAAELSIQSYAPRAGSFIIATPDSVDVAPSDVVVFDIFGATEEFYTAIVNGVEAEVLATDEHSVTIQVPALEEFAPGQLHEYTPWNTLLEVELQGDSQVAFSELRIVPPEDTILLTAAGPPYPESTVFPEGTEDGFPVYAVVLHGDNVEVLADGRSRADSSTWRVAALVWDTENESWLQRVRQFETLIEIPSAEITIAGYPPRIGQGSLSHYVVVVPSGSYLGLPQETVRARIRSGVLADGTTPAPYSGDYLAASEQEVIFEATGLSPATGYQVYYLVEDTEGHFLLDVQGFITASAVEVPTAEMEFVSYPPAVDSGLLVEVPKAALSFTRYAPTILASGALPSVTEVPPSGVVSFSIHGMQEVPQAVYIDGVAQTILSASAGAVEIEVQPLAEFSPDGLHATTRMYTDLVVLIEGETESVTTSLWIVPPASAIVRTAAGYPWPESSVLHPDTEEDDLVFFLVDEGEGVEVLANGLSRADSSTWQTTAYVFSQSAGHWLEAFTRRFDARAQILPAELTLQGYAPVVETSQHKRVEVPHRSLTFTSYEPFIEANGSRVVQIPKATVSITHYIPKVNIPFAAEIPPAEVEITGHPPEVSLGVILDIPQGELQLVSYNPEVRTTDHRRVEVPKAELTLVSYAPTIEASSFVDVEVPPAEINIVAFPPLISIGDMFVEVPFGNVVLQTFAPAIRSYRDREVPLPDRPRQFIVYGDGRTYTVPRRRR